jgi:hypothetical protein
MRLTLEELGHPQPPTPIHIDNSTTVGIVNNTVKHQKSRSMEMRYFWLLDREVQKLFSFKHHPGEEILADYPSKAHTAAYHRQVRPLFLHMKNSPRLLMRANKMPSERRGCVKKPEHTYLRSIRKYSLPSTNRHLPARITPVAASATNSAVATPTPAISGSRSWIKGPAKLCTYLLGTICPKYEISS